MANDSVHVKRFAHKDGGAVAFVTVTNAARLNCVDRATADALASVFVDLSRDDGLRCTVLTGAGDRAFIGGADLNELGSQDRDGARLFITSLHEACDAIRRCPVPVIGRVNGYCIGAGLEIAAACDMRVGVDTATFGMPEVHMGLPSVIEAALLPSLIGWGKTREILLTGEMFSAREAFEIGVLQKIVPAGELDCAVDAWVASICRTAPKASRAQKALMARWEASSVAEGVKAGIDALADAYLSGEPQDRIGAWLRRKK